MYIENRERRLKNKLTVKDMIVEILFVTGTERKNSEHA